MIPIKRLVQRLAPSLATRQDDVADLSAFRGQIGYAASAVFGRQ
ncbi:hypothetical protein GBL_2771 [Geobacillus kaustophilus GBlys]|uniref:Uncharacterized protein n=2 Tax=Geobacillus TaxID=129337 RepID=A0A7U9JAQ8_GEOTM|nr:hypothetical protein T260_10370 [Geobacillus sp. MAS1]GAD14554.1 hypothetical protein GBL_2771 [Geobacillus kaustophilus GBlys]